MKKVLTKDQIDALKKAVLDHPSKRYNASGACVIGRGRSAKESGDCILAWKDLLGKDLWDLLERITYPPELPIDGVAANIYEKGASFGLHIDGSYSGDPENNIITYTNIIVLERSDDLEGGLLVKTDLSFLNPYIISNIEFKNTPLEVLDLQEGEMTFWDNTTIHGVSQVKKGYRMTIGIGKLVKKNG